MAITVPRYDQSAVDTVAQPMHKRDFSTPDDFGAQIGESLQRGVNTVVDVESKRAAAELAKVNTISALNSRTAINKAEYDTYNGDETQPGYGILRKKGLAAVQDVPNAMANFDKSLAEIRKGLANDDQKFAFDKMAEERRMSIQEKLATFGRQQFDWHNNESLKATIQSSKDRIGLMYNDPKEVDREIGIIRLAADNRLTQEGVGADEASVMIRTNAMKQVESDARSIVLTKMLDEEDYEGALEYVEKHKDTFNADEKLNVRAIKKQIESDKKAAEVEAERARKAEQEAVRQEANKQLTDLTLDGKLKRKDVVKYRSVLNENEYYQWGQRVESTEKTARRAVESGEPKTSAGVYSSLLKKVLSDPDDPELEMQIADEVASGHITKADSRTLLSRKDRHSKATPEGKAASKAIVDALKADKKAGVFGEGQEADVELSRQLKALDSYMEKNPDKDPAEYYEKLMKPVKEGHVSKILDSVMGKFGYETTIGAKKPSPEELKKRREGMTGGGKGPKSGDVVKGYRFKGGNPANKASWEKVK